MSQVTRTWQQMFYVQVVHAASEFAGGGVWSLCEQQGCLKGQQAEIAVFKKHPNRDYRVLLAPFCLAQPHRSLKSAEWDFICLGKILRAFRGLTALAVKSVWSVFCWTQASCLALNVVSCFPPWSAKNNSELARSSNFKSVVRHKHVSLFYRDCLGRSLCFSYCLCKNN